MTTSLSAYSRVCGDCGKWNGEGGGSSATGGQGSSGCLLEEACRVKQCEACVHISRCTEQMEW